MILRPVFKYHLHVALPPHESVVYLLGEKRYFALKGRAFALLASLLDGKRTREQIMKTLSFEVSRDELDRALSLLEERGHICEADDAMPTEAAAFWSGAGVQTRDATQALQSGLVRLQALGNAPSGEVMESLVRSGIGTVRSHDPVSLDGALEKTVKLDVVLVEDYLQPGLDAINRKALDDGSPWLLAKILGREIWVGPLFWPKQTGCWECLAQRLRGNRQVETAIEGFSEHRVPIITSRSALPSTRQTASSVVVTEVAKWLAKGTSELEGRILTLDTDALAFETHRLVKRPQCPACGNEAAHGVRNPQPLTLQSRMKVFTDDGGHRSCMPEETLEKYGHHVSRLSGIIYELTHFFRDGHGLITIYRSPHILYHSGRDLDSIREFLGQHTSGKGKSETQARASALSEALERYCWQYTGNEPCTRASQNELGETAISLNEAMLFSEAQYQNREEHNREPVEDPVPDPFDPDRVVDWAPLWSLTEERFRYLPTAYCYAAYRPIPSPRFCWADSNGNSAGNVMEEAIVHGFLELVERDSVALWWYNRAHRPAVDLAGLEDHYVHTLQRYYETNGREFWIIDITSDLGIPAFAAINRLLEGEKEEIVMGFGAHFDPQIGILRALTEMNQLYYNTQASPEDWADNLRHQNVLEYLATGRVDTMPYLAPKGGESQQFESYPQLASSDLREDVETCVRIARGAGMDVLVLDQTRPDVGMYVVKVVVPGLRYWGARFGPGRLYDVPVRLGWVEGPLSEDNLNPTPFPH